MTNISITGSKSSHRRSDTPTRYDGDGDRTHCLSTLLLPWFRTMFVRIPLLALLMIAACQEPDPPRDPDTRRCAEGQVLTNFADGVQACLDQCSTDRDCSTCCVRQDPYSLCAPTLGHCGPPSEPATWPRYCCTDAGALGPYDNTSVPEGGACFGTDAHGSRWTGFACFGPESSDSPGLVLSSHTPVRYQGLVALTRDRSGTIWTGAAGTDGFGNALQSTGSFRIASVTKTFTAAALLSLVEEGVVELDVSVAPWLPELPPTITPRMLLTHQSGLPEFLAFYPSLVAPMTDASAVLRDAAGYWRGLAESYSNTNYFAIGVLIERLTGTAFHVVLRDRVLSPAGLSSTYLEAFEAGPPPVPGVTLSGAYYVPSEDQMHPSWGWAAGGLVSTVADLERFARELLVSRTLLSPSVVDAMVVGPSLYGLGVQRIDPCMRSRVVWHSGVHPNGGCSVFLQDLDSASFVALVTHARVGNCEDLSAIACELSLVADPFR